MMLKETKAMWQGVDGVWHFKKPCFSVPIPATELASLDASPRSGSALSVPEDSGIQYQHQTAHLK